MTYLSRLTLKRTPSTDALQGLLHPRDEAARIDAHHRLIWAGFAGDPKRKRDFLWRDEGGGRFIVLSPDPPRQTELFDEPEVKPFSPDLRSGDRIEFILRANATRTIKTDRVTANGKREREHQDAVMHLLKPIHRETRASARLDLAQEAGRHWLDGVGARHGFGVQSLLVRSYRVVDAPSRRGHRPRFGVLDIEGRIVVNDPQSFLAKYFIGFGRAKAFGCGLMLIRRA